MPGIERSLAKNQEQANGRRCNPKIEESSDSASMNTGPALCFRKDSVSRLQLCPPNTFSGLTPFEIVEYLTTDQKVVCSNHAGCMVDFERCTLINLNE